MRTALPIPAFARGRSKPPRRQLPYRFTIDRCRDKLALSGARVRIRGTTPGTKDRASAATSAARTTAPSAAGRRTAEDFARAVSKYVASATSTGSAAASSARTIRATNLPSGRSASLREEGIADPSIPLLRARLMLDHAREARDLAHGWPSMLGIDTIGLASFDAAEGVARNSYRQLLNIERADGDRLAASASPAELVVLLRRAQAERDEVVTQNLKLESRLTIAEVAIHTAQEENRAPIWPPACDASPPPSN